jgi:hypothetical protein
MSAAQSNKGSRYSHPKSGPFLIEISFAPIPINTKVDLPIPLVFPKINLSIPLFFGHRKLLEKGDPKLTIQYVRDGKNEMHVELLGMGD